MVRQPGGAGVGAHALKGGRQAPEQCQGWGVCRCRSGAPSRPGASGRFGCEVARRRRPRRFRTLDFPALKARQTPPPIK